jgi:hypothetical protein
MSILYAKLKKCTLKGLFAGEPTNTLTTRRHFRKSWEMKIFKFFDCAKKLFESVLVSIFSEKTGPTR